MRKLTTLFFICLLSLQAYSQDWETIKEDTRNYLSAEGYGETIDEADQQALATLISKISVVVSNNYEFVEGEKKTTEGDEYKRYIENKISTFSSATLTNTESLILSNEPNAHVARWIKRTELTKIFEARKQKVQEYVGNAVKAEAKGKIDDALRNFYWAYVLLVTLQCPSELTYEDAAGEKHVLVTWIPNVMDEIFDEIHPTVIGRTGDDVEIYFEYKDKPITSLDYTYFDGARWSNIYSAKDGKGVLELAQGAPSDNLQIKYEYAYKNEAHIDKELYAVINVVKMNSLRAAYVTLKGRTQKSVAKAVAKEDVAVAKKTTETLTKLDNESAIKKTMDKVVEAIRTKNYSSIDALFTAEGLDMYHRLITYGKAALVGTPAYSIYRNNESVVVRSIPMSFSFSRGVRKSFVEDVVFTFNSEGLIECLAFGLDEKASMDILGKQAWPENARMAIIEFLENYKTAFALKRLDYIKTIFDDNAVIIVGKVARVATTQQTDAAKLPNYNNVIVKRTRYSKEQYLKHLERCFASNEFVNIRFANNDVVKAGKGGEIYGIQIKQDYYSTNYGDTGYLFLLVDINKPKEPTIKVRTWQPEPDPVDGLFDISHF